MLTAPRLALALLVLAAAHVRAADELTPTKEEREALDLTNQERSKAGLAPLVASARLLLAARAHSANMAKQGVLDHTLDGKGPGERLAEVGYRHAGWGENCAQGQRTGAQAISSWMNSPGHRANLLNPDYREVGLGFARDERGTPYWTQVFAVPAGGAPPVIVPPAVVPPPVVLPAIRKREPVVLPPIRKRP